MTQFTNKPTYPTWKHIWWEAISRIDTPFQWVSRKLDTLDKRLIWCEHNGHDYEPDNTLIGWSFCRRCRLSTSKDVT